MVLSFSGGSSANFVNGVIGCVISLLAAAAATYFIGFDKNDPVVTGIAPVNAEENAPVTEVVACIGGTAVAQSEIPDEVFSTGMMGAGIGIDPSENVIIAPCDAVVSTVMEDSKHAVGLTLPNGAELLIHEGLDTVGLNGEGFQLFVKEGDRVKAGDKLIRFDADFIRSKGLNPVTVFLLTNSDDFPGASFATGAVQAGKTAVLHF